MKKITAVVALMAVAACSPQPEAPEALNGRWQVQQIAGASLGEGVDIWMEIDSDSGVISGFTGCNMFSAPLSAFSESLSVGAVTEAEGVCASEVEATDEARFLLVLPQVQRYIRHGASLELLQAPLGGEALLRLRAIDEPQGG